MGLSLIVGALISASTAVVSYTTQRKARKKSEQAAAEAQKAALAQQGIQEESQQVTTAQQTLEDRAARRRSMREARIRRAQILQAAANSDVAGSSGSSGGTSNITSTLGGAIANQRSAQRSGQRLGQLNIDYGRQDTRQLGLFSEAQSLNQRAGSISQFGQLASGLITSELGQNIFESLGGPSASNQPSSSPIPLARPTR